MSQNKSVRCTTKTACYRIHIQILFTYTPRYCSILTSLFRKTKTTTLKCKGIIIYRRFQKPEPLVLLIGINYDACSWPRSTYDTWTCTENWIQIRYRSIFVVLFYLPLNAVRLSTLLIQVTIFYKFQCLQFSFFPKQ